MKSRIFYILYWLLSHYIPQLILAALIIGTCLTSCRTTQHHFRDVTQMVIHDTIRVTDTQVTDLSALSTLRYEQTILDLRTRIDSLTGSPRRDTVRITHTRWQKADTVILHHHDTITVLQHHTDSTAIVRQDTTVSTPTSPLSSPWVNWLFFFVVILTPIIACRIYNSRK